MQIINDNIKTPLMEIICYNNNGEKYIGVSCGVTEGHVCRLDFTKTPDDGKYISVTTQKTTGERIKVGFDKFSDAFSLFLLPSAKGKGEVGIDKEIAKMSINSLFEMGSIRVNTVMEVASFEEFQNNLRTNLKHNKKKFPLVKIDTTDGEKLNDELYNYVSKFQKQLTS
jgi:hypothetical protein